MIKIPQILLTIALSRFRVHLGLLLLALLVPASLAWAEPYKQPSWKKNVKAGVELGFGVPYGLSIDEKTIKEKELDNIKVNPHWRVGMIGGYGFPFLDDTLAVGLDVGLFLANKRKFEAPLKEAPLKCVEKAVLELEEQYLHIPCALKLVTFDKETGVQESGLTLGYELNILLSCKSSLSFGRYKLESIPKSPKLGGSIFLGGKIDLVAGCYLMGQFKFPVTDFLGLKDANQNGDGAKADFHLIRCLGASFVELSLGFNIMKWL